MPDTDIKFDLSQAGVGKVIFFNPKRKEYKDFIPFWKGAELQGILSNNFSEMFNTYGWATWDNDNVESGRMKESLVKTENGGGEFPKENRLRDYRPQSMTWGINVNAAGFQTKGGTPYPYYPLAKNPIAFIASNYANQIPVAIGRYLVKVMQKMKGL